MFLVNEFDEGDSSKGMGQVRKMNDPMQQTEPLELPRADCLNQSKGQVVRVG